MRLRRLLLPALACALVAASAPAAADAPARGGSWPDADHGWVLYTPELGCTPRADLCATEDGGATWHGIFNGSVADFERTSVRAGVVSIGDDVYWTRDAGRRWYRTTKVFGHYAGHGSLLFATSDTDLYRVGPWPPPSNVRCRGIWRAAAGDTRARGAAHAVVCNGAPADAGLRARLVATVSGSAIGDLTSVPGGVFGVSDGGSDLGRLNAFVWRLGHLTEVPLPFPKPGWWCCAQVHAAWPHLFVTGQLYSPPGSADQMLDVVWESADGGASWSAYVK
jgi:hypothetical protein